MGEAFDNHVSYMAAVYMQTKHPHEPKLTTDEKNQVAIKTTHFLGLMNNDRISPMVMAENKDDLKQALNTDAVKALKQSVAVEVESVRKDRALEHKEHASGSVSPTHVAKNTAASPAAKKSAETTTPQAEHNGQAQHPSQIRSANGVKLDPFFSR